MSKSYVHLVYFTDNVGRVVRINIANVASFVETEDISCNEIKGSVFEFLFMSGIAEKYYVPKRELGMFRNSLGLLER